jgi:isocitrate dehydrogenase
MMLKTLFDQHISTRLILPAHFPLQVTAVHKANIMKLGDGMFLKACREVAPQFPTIKYEEMIVDNTCMQVRAYTHRQELDSRQPTWW